MIIVSISCHFTFVFKQPEIQQTNNHCPCFSFKPIIQYVDDQFERYLQDESGLNRRHIIDNRVHCCFFFINPSGHGYEYWVLRLNEYLV